MTDDPAQVAELLHLRNAVGGRMVHINRKPMTYGALRRMDRRPGIQHRRHHATGFRAASSRPTTTRTWRRCSREPRTVRTARPVYPV